MTHPAGSPEPDPALPESFAAKLKQHFGEGVDTGVSLHAAGDSEAKGENEADFSSALVARLTGRSGSFGRYRVKGEIARGGMGAILKIWDEDLHRHLAMKVILGQVEARPSHAGMQASGESRKPAGQPDTPPIEMSKLARFLEEAQVTGQLDHPGIVPVHELGLDPEGRVYFTMKLVKGQSLKEVFDLVAEKKEGWSQTKALGVLLKVCEAMAYAHDKGVIHRDLKPANVMVGKFGEVHVMDWGLARILGRKDERDLRIRAEILTTSTELRSERDTHRAETPESPLYTMDGDVVGTPAYMPPEQAAGRVSEMGPHSDVYALGAMLYHLIARHMPYVPSGAKLNNYAVWGLVQQGPPTPIAQLARETPAELVAICEKAMARDWKRRYRDMSEMAADLSAYLEHRVVGAYESGAWAETKKWIERNKPLAASLAAGVLLLAAGLLVSLSLKEQADHNARVAGLERDTAFGLADLKRLSDLRQTAEELWPAHPEKVAALQAWLADANELVDHLPKHREHLSRVDQIVSGVRRIDSSPDQPSGPKRARTSSGLEMEWLKEELEGLIHELEAFAADRPQPGAMKDVATRLEFAQTIEERSVSGSLARQRWGEAIQAISRSDHYQDTTWPSGQQLSPQLGLLPIGADPDSGLWEFAHLASGEPAERGSDGGLLLEESMGLVFVLIPGETFRMGAQSTDPTEPNYSPMASGDESPVHDVTLSPYLISKYEMTQGQWERFTGSNPSTYGPDRYSTDWNRTGNGWTALHPVEQVNWTECMDVMRRLGLSLPSEAQWENAARGGSEMPWWTGSDLESLEDAANLSDAYGKSHGNESWSVWEAGFDDGNTVHADVGSYRANPVGLHDVIGNTWEWCCDGFDNSFYGRSPNLDPVAPLSGAPLRVFRGGGFFSEASRARSTSRGVEAPDYQSNALGLRPARALQSSPTQLHPAGK